VSIHILLTGVTIYTLAHCKLLLKKHLAENLYGVRLYINEQNQHEQVMKLHYRKRFTIIHAQLINKLRFALGIRNNLS